MLSHMVAPVAPEHGGRTLAWAGAVVEPGLRAAVGRLCPSVRRVVGYHQGWWDAQGVPCEGSPGKGLRAALALLSARATSPDALLGVPAAVAVELVHSFTLLHDDLVDGDRTRRGRPAAWTVFGVPAAILAGDSLLAAGIDTLLTSGHPSAQAAAATLTQTLQDLVNGQCADLDFEFRDDVTPEQFLAMIAHKTGSLLGCACALGTLLAGGSQERVAALGRFGRNLGLAFQLTDDLLGLWGATSVLGEPVGSDLLRRRKSFPVLAALRSGWPAATELAHFYTRTTAPGAADIPDMLRLVETCGGREATEHRAERAVHQARRQLDILPMPTDVRDEFQQLLAMAARRDQ